MPLTLLSSKQARPGRVTLLAAGIILVAALLLLWQTWNMSRHQHAQEQEQEHTVRSVNNLAHEFGEYIDDYRHSVRLFALGHLDLLRRIAHDPDDVQAIEQLHARALKLLPESFGVSLADEHGQTYFTDFDGLLNTQCTDEITRFARVHKPNVVIHPNPAGYHFDIMDAVSLSQDHTAIFFVSFHPTHLIHELRNRMIPGYQLMVLNTARPGLIEFTEQGVRTRLKERDTLFLSDSERQAIVARAAIPDSQWELVALPRSSSVPNHATQVWHEGLWHLLILLTGGLMVLGFLWREEKRASLKDHENRRHSERLEANSQRLQRLHALTSDENLDFDALFQRILELGCEVFGKQVGIISHITGDDYRVRHCISPGGALQPGMYFHLDETFCRDVVAQCLPRHEDDVPHSDWKSHPAYTKFHLQSYLGAPVIFGGELYGTLNFSSPGTSPLPTTSDDIDFLRLLAQWVGYEIRRQQTKATLYAQNALMGAISRSQNNFITDAPPDQLFAALLADILTFTHSQAGFIGEVLIGSDGNPKLEPQGVNCLSPHITDATGRMRDAPIPQALQALSEHVMHTGETVFCNTPDAVFTQLGLPAPPEGITTLVALPLYSGTRLIGVLTLANRDQGYDQPLLDELAPLLGTCGNLLTANRANQTLHETQSLQRAILSSTSYMMIATDPAGTIILFNPAAEATLGYRAEALIGLHSPAQFHDPDEVAQRAQQLSEELGEVIMPGFEVFVARARRGEVEERPWTYLCRDGSRLPVRLVVSAVRDTAGELTGFLGVARDLTAEQTMITSLRQSEARLADAQRIAHYGNWEWNILSDESFWSDESFRIFGHEPQAFVPDYAQYLNQVHPDDRKEVELLLKTTLKTGSPYQHEHRIVRPDGSTRVIQDRGEVRHNALGEPIAMTGTIHDVTELRHVDRMKTEFISTVSHELRTPLTSIQGSLGLLIGGVGGDLPEQARSLLDIAHNNARRLLLLINDILDLSKIESGKLTFHFRELDVTPFIEQAITHNQPYGEQYKVKFVITESMEGARIRADSDRLMQVMNNLLSNAAKFSPTGSQVEIGARSDGGTLHVYVHDHGTGIPEQFQHKVFDKFAQADSSDTRPQGGTGLGLNIARSIVEAHGGRLNFVSAPGEGTTFYFELPLIARQPDAPQGNRGHTLLICEDDPQLAQVLLHTMTKHGFDADIAYSAAEARALLASRDYLAMTLDLILPDEDGVNLLKDLRESPATRELPIIVVSAVADEARDSFTGNALYIIDWLDKPFDQHRLLNAVRAAGSLRTADNATRVLHIEDDPDISEIVRVMLGDKATVVHETDLRGARQRLAASRFDLILLDIALPDGSGLSLLDDIHLIEPPPAVVIFSALELDNDVASNINAVLVKSRTGNRELLDTILSYLPEPDPGTAPTNAPQH